MTVHIGPPTQDIVHEVCVVGGGPLGIAAALECEKLGLPVLVLEAGRANPASTSARDHIVEPARHAPLENAMCMALGGSSWWWGGRCLPLDPVDFMERPILSEPGFPIAYRDVEPFHSKAAAYLDCGSDDFTASHSEWADLGGGVHISALERWSRTREMARLHGPHLMQSTGVAVHLDTNVISIESEGGTVTGIRVGAPGKTFLVRAKKVVLACGGLGVARLLQQHQKKHPAAFGGTQGALGHYYMGHLQGRIADIILNDPDDAELLDFSLDETATWVRRRISISAATQLDAGILNTAFWVDNPAFHDHRHGSGILSAVFLALCFPPLGRLLLPEGIRLMHIGKGDRHIAKHVGNVVMQPFSTTVSAWKILRQRYFEKPRRPGFLIRNNKGRYALTFHGEHIPRRESYAKIVGSDNDSVGSIDLSFSRKDALSVVRAHELVDESLRAAGRGRLEYHFPENDRADAVLEQASDGYHQIGLTRMGMDPATSVVDRECRVHGYDNLFVASTAVLPVSGQANPTFTACALAVRLAHHMAETVNAHAVA